MLFLWYKSPGIDLQLGRVNSDIEINVHESQWKMERGRQECPEDGREHLLISVLHNMTRNWRKICKVPRQMGENAEDVDGLTKAGLSEQDVLPFDEVAEGPGRQHSAPAHSEELQDREVVVRTRREEERRCARNFMKVWKKLFVHGGVFCHVCEPRFAASTS